MRLWDKLTDNIFVFSLTAKRDLVLILFLYLYNCFTFSAYPLLGQVAIKPWLLLVWLYGFAMLVPLFWRNRAPVVVFIGQLIATVIALPFLSIYSPVVGIPVALYTVAAYRNKPVSLLALLLSIIPNGLVATVAGFASGQPATSVNTGIFLIVTAIGALVGGQLTQATRRHIEYLEREQAATREAEERKHTAAWEAEVVARERRRIAGELHDSISHAVTVIVLLASGAAQIADTSSAQAKQSLINIATVAKQAMSELRRLLTVLDSGSAEHTSRNSVPGLEHNLQSGLAGVPALLEAVRAAGISVSVLHEGTKSVLPPNVELTAYRIIQEGLTNVLKHAGKHAKPRLRLIWDSASLLIQIDNGTGPVKVVKPQENTYGWGLRGIRERVDAVGGDLRFGPDEEVGYRLTAVLPVTMSAPVKLAPANLPPLSDQNNENQNEHNSNSSDGHG